MHIQVLYGEREVDRKIISQKKKKRSYFSEYVDPINAVILHPKISNFIDPKNFTNTYFICYAFTMTNYNACIVTSLTLGLE
jgi:hypothetical protein